MSAPERHPWRLACAMCCALIAHMLPFSALSALLPELMDAWQLSSARAGWLSSAFFLGYMGAAPLLTAATDRRDARGVCLWGAPLSVLGTLGFALSEGELALALAARVLQGGGVAAAFMPGLRALSDRVSPGQMARPIAFYTASFGVGTSLSFVATDSLASWLGRTQALAAVAIGPALGGLLVALATRPLPPPAAPKGAHAAVADVLHSRRIMPFVLAYGVHCWELFAMRAWIVALLGFVWQGQAPWISAAWAAALINVLGAPASVLGNELSLRIGRRGLIGTAMLLTPALGVVCVLASFAPWWLTLLLAVLYGVGIASDSAAITSGMVEAAPADVRGAAMAVHTTVGFAGGLLGPLWIGLWLDPFGGIATQSGWLWALGSSSLLVALGALALPLLGAATSATAHRAP